MNCDELGSGELRTHLLVAAITNLGHGKLALEPTPHSVIDTFRFPPCLLDTVVTIGLVTPNRGISVRSDGRGKRRT